MPRILVLAATVIPISCTNPRVEANVAQAINEIGPTISAMQQDYALLQQQVDSLRGVVAHQDTVISRLASMAGLPLNQR
ncbi:MAG TPA: hypothetical protein VJ867_00905 [Gemmatimonadaceae bacterium]|nr:hypothetical protein [Gemmatimonadaceae bacterium]